jgi:hypothetical protein
MKTKEAMAIKLDRYIVGQEGLKGFLMDAVSKHYRKGIPQRVLLCGVDHRTVWNMLRYLSDVVCVDPVHWNMKNIDRNVTVETIMGNIIFKYDDANTSTEKLDINHIANADLLNDSTSHSLMEMMAGKELRTEVTGKVVNTKKMMYVFSTEKTMDEMSDELVSLMTAIYN